MMVEAMARVKYNCKTDAGKKYSVTAELIDNWGFQYGNHHGIVVTEDTGYAYGLDARYDQRFGTVDGFYENILDVLKGRYNIADAELVEKE